jgi:hypothetical protein
MGELKGDPEALRIQAWKKKVLDQNTGDIESAFGGYECLTVKPQSRNDQGMKEMEKQNKPSNLNVSLPIFTLPFFS